ncbi:uncharacterized protein LOC134746951 isoform X2 [Cydia strobilella]|uniref:uncharacterized protein LOC134746951 isoform X2 n=1 Tax=Cydia strobilella TaxID=1100964 RepID=UPI0030063054
MLSIIFLIVTTGIVLDSAYGANICFDAKICIHNAVEKCGIDATKGVRRFLDTCDITEYNCQHKTDYRKTDMDKCKDLPQIFPD